MFAISSGFVILLVARAEYDKGDRAVLPFTDALETRVLYREDNLERLVQMPSESVDLVYLDPPFFSNKVYEVIWGDEAEVRSFEDRWEGGIQHYIGWMKERLVELHRVLKPSGSLYLHCDPHASHYLKVMLDGVFGSARFRNEVVWKRTSAHNRLRRFGPVHDVILFYTKSDRWTWNAQYVPYDVDYVDNFYRHIEPETGRRYRLSDVTSNRPGGRYLLNGQPPPGNRYWGYSEETMLKFEASGRLVYSRNGIPSYKRYLDEMPGQLIQDVWTDIPPLSSGSSEREGWPTQKPESLLERIISASSNPGDVVLDPFCGCGTTVAVAERLARPWIGIDISQTAMDIMVWRLDKDTHGWRPPVFGAVDTIDDLRALKPFEFQNWVIRAMDGEHSPKKSGDMGIDGYSFMHRYPIQVKQSEKVGRNVVDNFETAVRRAKHDTGYIVAFSFTKDAFEEAARAKAEDGLNITLVKVAEVMLLRKRPGNPPRSLSGIVPAASVPKPPPSIPKATHRASAEQLVASDRGSAVG